MKWMMTGLTLASTVQAASRPPEDRAPNVVLIMTDDQGYGDFSNMDHPYLKTPNLDRLKSQSVSLENFLVAPVCAPTRAMLMTGRYPYRTGTHDTYQSRVNMWGDEKTIGEYFQDAGYVTGLFGKWHLGYNYPLRAGDQGFDTYVTWQEMQHSRQRPLLEEDGVFTYHANFMSDVFRDKAVEFIRKNKDRPFFCYYPLYLPHSHSDNLEITLAYRRRFAEYPEVDARSQAIYGMIEKADELIGTVLDELDKLGLSECTIVVFLSDNGPTSIRHLDGSLDRNAGLRGRKGSVYEGGIRVPFYVRWPGRLEAGTTVDRMGHVGDVLPTVLDLSGITPATWEKPLDGQSLVPLLTGSGTDWPDRYYFLHWVRQGKEAIHAAKWKSSTVRGERWKLVNGQELYDLQEDPAEARNVAEHFPDIVTDLRDRYTAWFAAVTAERDLQAAPNIVGSAAQPEVHLYFFEKNQEAAPAGWPIEVATEGTYMVCVENLQHHMFGEGVVAVLRCGDVERRQQLDPKLADLVFEGVNLPLGRHVLELDFEGDVTPKPWRYGLQDLGHRLVWIRKE